MKNEVTTKIPKRQISLKSGVHLNTITKFFKGEQILFSKEQQIKKAIAEIIEQSKKNDDIILRA